MFSRCKAGQSLMESGEIVMKSGALERKIFACLAALMAAVLPIILTGCGGGIISPIGGSQQSSTLSVVSVIPDTGPTSGGTTVTVNGSNFTSGPQPKQLSVSFGGVQSPHVTVMSSDQLRVVVPPHAAGSVSVHVSDSSGNSASLPSAFKYTSASITINSVSPNTGSISGGTPVVITGSNFASGATVSFGGTPATGVSFVSSTQLNATTPAHAAGAVSVSVTNPNGTSGILPNAFTYSSSPSSSSTAVSSVSPISGPAAGGTQVTITGFNFQAGVSVTFGGLAATSVTLSNSTTIVAVTPAHSAGAATVTVTNSNGQSASLPSGFTFHSVDLVWSAPSSSSAPIAGYNVYRGSASTGPFGRLNGSTLVISTSFTDPTVQGSTTYYYEVKSVDPNGVESPPAGPVAATIGP